MSGSGTRATPPKLSPIIKSNTQEPKLPATAPSAPPHPPSKLQSQSTASTPDHLPQEQQQQRSATNPEPTAPPTAPGSGTVSAGTNPPKTNRVRWHGNTDLAPSRVHAAAVAAAAAANAARPPIAASSTASSSNLLSVPASATRLGPSLNPHEGLPKGGVIVPPQPEAVQETSTEASVPSQRIKRANHPGPLMLKQRLSDTGVTGGGIPPSSTSTSPEDGVEDEDEEVEAEAVRDHPIILPMPSSAARNAAAAVKPSILSARLPFTQSPLPQLLLHHHDNDLNASTNSNHSARELDERGMDEAAFQLLQAQLQLEAKRDGPNTTTTNANAASTQHQQQPDRKQRRAALSALSSAGTSGPASGASTPYSTDSSYDPMADSDLEHIDLIEGEVDGMPARLSKREKQKIREKEEEERELARGNRGTGWARLRRLVGGGIGGSGDAKPEGDEDVESAAAEKARYADDEGAGRDGPTNRKSVPVTTSSGTHGGAAEGLKRKPTKYERQAAKLVKAHKLVASASGGGGAASMPTSSSAGIDGALFAVAGRGDHSHHHPHHHHHHAQEDGDHSRSSSPEPFDMDPRPVASGGVLGNLLRLYESQNARRASDGGIGGGMGSSAVSRNASLSSLDRSPPLTARFQPAGHSRLRKTHRPSDSTTSGGGPGDETVAKSSAVDPTVGGRAQAELLDMSPEALAARAMEKERKERVRQIEEQLRRTLAPQNLGTSKTTQQKRGRSQQASTLAGLMSSEYRRGSVGLGSRTPRRSWDGHSMASSAGGYQHSAAGSNRRPMMQSISSSAFPISAAVMEKTQQGGKVLSKAASHVAKVAVAETGLESAMDERPKAARNGGGTIGALIATTGNLVGAVSPHLAQLGPNPKRPGFTLDRYLLPEMNAKTLRQTAEIVADASLPPRSWRSVPGTPNMWASRSAPGTPGGSRSQSQSHSHSHSGSRTRNDSVVGLHSQGEGVGMNDPASRPTISVDGTGLIDDRARGGEGRQADIYTGGSVSPRESGTMTVGTNSPKDRSEKTISLDGHANNATKTGHPMSRAFSAGMRSMPPTPGGGGHHSGFSHLRSRSSIALSHLPGVHSAGHMFHRAWSGLASGMNTPDPDGGGMGSDYFSAKGAGTSGVSSTTNVEDLEKMEWQRKLKRRAKKRKKEEIFITMHVAAILQRQEFLLKLARALMMFGAPTHKLESQIQHTARVLEINCRIIYLPNLMLLSFGDDATRTSETKFIKQTAGLDLTKLTDMHDVYWNVVRDKISVTEASEQLDELMRRKPLIPRIPTILIGGLCSAFICVGGMGFNGSFIDAVAAFPLGMFLVYCQGIITTELYSNVFEIVFCVINSFVAAALHSTGIFCYSSVVSGSIVLILPGFIVLSGALELQSKNLIAGSVRLVYAIIYSLFLGMGLSIGVDFWTLVNNKPLDNASYCDANHHNPDVWYRRNVNLIWALLTVPGYSTVLSLRNQAKVTRKEFPAMVLIACAGWACNHYASTAKTLKGRQDITSALGSFAVGLLANLYGRFTGGRAFVVAVPGILYQLPSGLSNGGLLNFVDITANTNATMASGGTSTVAFSNSGFSVAASLIEVALGLTVGLFAATIVGHYLTSKRQRGTMVFSF
ncbi:hypothetical protein A4X09_0g3470 [Tilletia walkeri]|uniref:Threonine/serine exporter-like N-terminal domain-containing protein n=1 Tax=Tilletia walkeri TaxID=117179 RepID=A0A8X7T4W9_9BASI|nr:hypothetical protein A4X09_0g3470 [Tilletia walkeri]